MKKWMGWAAFLLFVMPAFISPSLVAGEQEIVVGRIFHIDGNLFRYGTQYSELNAVFEDEPFGAEDTFFSEADGSAELIIPNGTWIRVGTRTQIRFADLRADLVETELLTGMARFYNKNPETVIRVISPFGNVTAHFGSVFDVYVGENAVEVLAVKGNVRFFQSATGAEYTVESASPSIVADDHQVWAGEGSIRPDWDQWNMMRDRFWAEKAREKGPSSDYLPAYLHDEAYALDENGRWENIFYEGSMCYFWRPSIVGSAWSPYSRGRWISWYGDQTWVPTEPFGYLTHHYGNWIHLSNRWYWAPPPKPARAFSSWYPGRVFWIHSKDHIGWVPLGPRETYYSRRHWGGPHTKVVTNWNTSQIHIDERNFAYSKHAVFVKRDNFKRVNNYKNVREKDVRRSEQYHAGPVADNPMIRRDISTESGRHASNNHFQSTLPSRTSNATMRQYKAPHGEEKNTKSSGVQKYRKRVPEATDIGELRKKDAGRMRRDKSQDEKHTAKPGINFLEKKRGMVVEQGAKLSSPLRPEKPKRPSMSESLRNRKPEIKAGGTRKLKSDDLRNSALRKEPQQSGRMERGSRLSDSKEPNHNQIDKAASGERIPPRSKSENFLREKQRNLLPARLEESSQNRTPEGIPPMKKQSLPGRSWSRDRR